MSASSATSSTRVCSTTRPWCSSATTASASATCSRRTRHAPLTGGCKLQFPADPNKAATAAIAGLPGEHAADDVRGAAGLGAAPLQAGRPAHGVQPPPPAHRVRPAPHAGAHDGPQQPGGRARPRRHGPREEGVCRQGGATV